jgi:hypothetical protein
LSSEHDAPLDSPPTNFDHITYESLDPPKEADPEIRGDKTGLDEAAAELAQTPAERNQVIERTWGDPRDWSKHAPGNRTVSVEHAGDMLAETRRAEAQFEQAEIDAATARAVDDFRGEQPQPEQPEFQQPKPQAPEVQPEYVAEPDDELSRLLASVPDENVRRNVRQGLIEYHAHEAAVAHANAAAAALEQRTLETFLVAEQAALAPFPELANVRREDMQVVLNHIRQTNPQRFEEIDRHVARVKGLAANQLQTMQVLHQQQQASSQAQQAQQQQAFRQYSEYHDARVGDVPTEVANEVVAMAQEHGISKQELLQLYETSPVIRHSAFQQMMANAAKYRLAQRNIPRAVSRPIPQVQRPGTASEEARDYSEVSSLQREFNLKPTAKTAAALLAARRGAR